MDVPVSVDKLTNTELFSLEHLLWKIERGEKSPSALRLALVLREEIRWRTKFTLTGLKEIGKSD